MTHRERLISMLVVLLLLAGAKLVQQLYSFYASKEERIEIARLEMGIEDAGFGIISTQIEADSLLEEVRRLDEELRAGRTRIEELERRLVGGSVTLAEERSYRERLAAHNGRVDERNAIYRRWRATVDNNSTYVERYNAIADSIRALANALGEPYYPILSPAEIAVRREGLPRER
jgi:predicted  nucleic acid-binding Zn-ribbon protein